MQDQRKPVTKIPNHDGLRVETKFGQSRALLVRVAKPSGSSQQLIACLDWVTPPEFSAERGQPCEFTAGRGRSIRWDVEDGVIHNERDLRAGASADASGGSALPGPTPADPST